MQNLEEYSILNMLQAYNGGGMYIALYCAALFYVFAKGDRKQKAVFLYPSAFLVLTVFNPLLAPLLMDIGGEDATYYRFAWAFPIVILLAYTATRLILGQSRNIQKLIVSVACVLTLIICGSFIGTQFGSRPENSYKVQDSLLQVDSILKEDQQKNEQLQDAEPVAVGPDEIIYNLRLYDPSIKLAYGRNEILWGVEEWGEWGAQFMTPLLSVFSQGQAVPAEMLSQALTTADVTYMILPASSPVAPLLEEVGAHMFAATPGYWLYKF